LRRAGLDVVPALFVAAGDRAAFRFVEFFTANIRNPNTRAAYAQAVRRFCGWCEAEGYRLEQLTPVHVAAYVEQLGKRKDEGGAGMSKPSVKQHLAALRMLFDWLVTGQVVPHNPAASVRGPKYVVKKGKTPVLTAEEARQLLDTILPARAAVLAVDPGRRTVTVRVEDGGREKNIEVSDEVRLVPEDGRKAFRLEDLAPGDRLRVVQRGGSVAALRRGWGEDALADLRDRALVGVMASWSIRSPASAPCWG
jgi:integrase